MNCWIWHLSQGKWTWSLVESVTKFTYLGSDVVSGSSSTPEVHRRIGLANSILGQLDWVWRNRRLSLNTKRRLYTSLVQSVLLHGSETWTLTKAHSARLQTFHIKAQRRILNIKWYDFVTNDSVRSQTKLTDHTSHHSWQKTLIARTCSEWYFPGGMGRHVLVTEFWGMAPKGLFCADVLRPLDLVPLTDFSYKYHPGPVCRLPPDVPAHNILQHCVNLSQGRPRLEASTWLAKEDLDTTGGRGSRVHNRLAVDIGIHYPLKLKQ